MMKMLCQCCQVERHDYECTKMSGEVICKECYDEKYNEEMVEFDHSEE